MTALWPIHGLFSEIFAAIDMQKCRIVDLWDELRVWASIQ